MLPPTLHNLTAEEIEHQVETLKAPFRDAVRAMQIDSDLDRDLLDIYLPLAATLKQNAARHDGPLLVGINGAQGAGKSTFCRLLETVLKAGFAQSVCTISIDDLYLTHAERQHLAETVHPLLATRGVPGTHDVALGLDLFQALRTLPPGQTLALPRFDKAVDDRCAEHTWPEVSGPLNLILFEGWCVASRPQDETDLDEPVNSLEKDEDPELSWRRYVNQQLATDYARLFAEIDLLVMLQVPGMESVLQWRSLQEQKLAQDRPGETSDRIMDAAALTRFIMHYERLTRWTLEEMPDRADLVLELNAEHRIDGVRLNTLALPGGV